MKIKIIKIITTLIAIVSLTFTPAIAFANCSEDVCSGNYPSSVKAACGCDITPGEDKLPKVIGSIISAVIGILGLVAIIFIVVGGVGYMTSAGDANKLKKAKDTILYACIGLVICALAFAITQFTINAINGAAGSP